MKFNNDDLKDRDEISPKKIRQELILYLLSKYGPLRTKELSKILGHSPRTIRRTLKSLEDSGQINGDKLGKDFIWSKTEKDKFIYF